MENNLPLHVVDCLSVSPEKHPEATLRVYDFVTKALAEVEAECRDLDIGFHVLVGASPADNLLTWMDKFKVLFIPYFSFQYYRSFYIPITINLKVVYCYESKISVFDLLQVGCFVADFSPLRHHRGNLAKLQEGLEAKDGPCLYQVIFYDIVL